MTVKLEILGKLLTAARSLVGGTDLMGIEHRGAELGRSDRLVDEVRKYLDEFDRLSEAEAFTHTSKKGESHG